MITNVPLLSEGFGVYQDQASKQYKEGFETKQESHERAPTERSSRLMNGAPISTCDNYPTHQINKTGTAFYPLHHNPTIKSIKGVQEANGFNQYASL